MENKSDDLNKKAATAGIWYTIGNIFLKGCVFLSLPIFTRIMTVDDFGIYNTYIAYEAIVAAALGLGFYATIKNAKLKYNNNFNSYLSSIVTINIVFLLIVLLLSNCLYPIYSDALGYSRLVVNMLIYQSFASSLIQIYSCKLNIEFKYKSYLFISALNTFLNIGLSIIFVVFVFPNEQYLGRIIGTIFPLVLISVYIIFVIYLKGKKLFDKKFCLFALKLGLPLIPHVLSQSLLSQFDRIMITQFCGDYDAGIYSFIYSVSTILSVLALSFDNAWTPWVYYKKNSSMEIDVKIASRKYVLFFGLLTLGFVSIIPEAIMILGSKDYQVGIPMIVPLSLSNFFIFLYFIPVNLEYYNNKTLFVSVGTVMASIINFVLNLIFIPKFGYMAAAYTTLISYFLLFVFHMIIARKSGLNKCYDTMYIFVIIGLMLVVCSINLFLLDYKFISIIFRYTIVLCIIVYLVINRKKYLMVLKKK